MRLVSRQWKRLPDKVAELVDELLQKHWNRTAGAVEEIAVPEVQEPVQATCSCGSGIPVQEIVDQRADGHLDRTAAHLPAVP